MKSSNSRDRVAAMTPMRVVSSLELFSLLTIVVNRVTVHYPAITATGGPIHGLLYVATIVLALLLPFPRSAKWLAVIPGVGGILALWRARYIGAVADAQPTAGHAFDVELTEGDRSTAAVVVDCATATLSNATKIGPLTFSVPRGRITGLIGPNGAGKTTALRMLCGLVESDAGGICVEPSDCNDTAHCAHTGGSPADLGVLIESPGFLPGLTARQNLRVLTRLAGWADEVADTALERVGLTESADRRVSTYSLGMKQRLGLAAALLGHPSTIILDEPTNGLDPHGIVELRTFLRSLATDGVTVIIASHALDEIEELCDHVVAMNHGRVMFNGSPNRLLESRSGTIRCRTDDPAATRAVLEIFTGQGHSAQLDHDGAIVVMGEPHIAATLNDSAFAAGVVLTEISPVRPTLTDAFLAAMSSADAEGFRPPTPSTSTLAAVR
ncbi:MULTISPECIES: ATP-binding cassette domain-containing protein [Nocardiaceae]|uniref:ATP-binding cassette domain-containing protein n=1 Tax=Rhodococcoides kroppenstedtii TaxID=293050 RepID=A0ABS7NU52_9NOCA|nr:MULTISPECIES: ATP-binding cassette domain-containing protein [Rhodococcus]AMY20687.1 ABC transporter ATP-binding protein NatA [Rhodococcus sp. PBTS 1]MBY6313346.1 ATP-binding cassette domain-containing protein [Rhodococcus kroppenstedtii]MBY6321237.1 ATP-binding cassette domain-containing protein [Rhodococcus kroppenstedtii]MBY6400346.1 ATP-binding cassette domain-containing protein [Rhodococcus kroppenstedtii]